MHRQKANGKAPAGVLRAFGAGIPVGLFMVGLCLLGLALGIALITAAVWLVAWLLPACWRLILRAWRALTGKKEA